MTSICKPLISPNGFVVGSATATAAETVTLHRSRRRNLITFTAYQIATRHPYV
jgi:hypothetical protein